MGVRKIYTRGQAERVRHDVPGTDRKRERRRHAYDGTGKANSRRPPPSIRYRGRLGATNAHVPNGKRVLCDCTKTYLNILLLLGFLLVALPQSLPKGLYIFVIYILRFRKRRRHCSQISV